jgi:hypothetical protein
METLIIEHLDRPTSKVFKQMAKVLGLSFKIKTVHNSIEQPAIITNPEIIARIEAHEANKRDGNLKDYKRFTMQELKQEIQNNA